jgi:hypothetical protein
MELGNGKLMGMVDAQGANSRIKMRLFQGRKYLFSGFSLTATT